MDNYEFKGVKALKFNELIEKMNELGILGWDSAGITIKDNSPYNPYYLAIMKRKVEE